MTRPDVEVRTWQGSEPGVLLVHGTGFCKELWDPVVADLGVNSTAFDQRGHGESPPLSIPVDWSEIAEDVARVTEAASAPPRIGVGHSSGGAGIAMAAVAHPGLFDHLILIEPIITPPPHERHEDEPLAAAVEQRRRSFPDRAAARAHFAATRAFSGWVPEALDAYVAGGLREDDGAVVLRCSPQTEAEHYRAGWEHPTWEYVHEIACPVTLIAGVGSTTHHGAYLDALAARFADVDLQVVPNATHFVPMEHPEVVARAILDARGSG